jgi:phosphatidylglycerophosphate synthase
VARHVNRHVSLAISRVLCRTRVHPNHVPALTFLVGCAAAALAALGTYAAMLAGAFLYQWKSILDGVDGELARLKFQGSRLGEWLDTVGDDLSNLLFYAGITVGAWRASGDPTWIWLGGAGVVLAAACSGIMYHWIWTRRRTGDLLAFTWFFEEPAGRGADGRLLGRLKYLAKQDFFVLLFFVLALFGALPAALYLVCAAGAVLLGLLAFQLGREARSGARRTQERSASSPSRVSR